MAQAAIAVREKSPEAFRTISEVADDLDVPQHVLRFWESRFAQIKPVKRAGGRRYYRPEDVDLLRGIRALLYTEGYTIKGVQKVLRDRGLKYVTAIGQGKPAQQSVPVSPPPPPAPPPPIPAEAKVTPFRPRVIKAKQPVLQQPGLFDLTEEAAPPKKMVADIRKAYAAQAEPALAQARENAVAAEERKRLETLLGELEGLKTRLKNRPKLG